MSRRRRAQPGLNEFERIARYFAPLAGRGALGLTDDVAFIPGPRGTEYVLTTDAIVEGIDYFLTDPPDAIAQKLLRVNLSDLAAKGAKPVGYLLTTVLDNKHGTEWLAKFSAGLAADQKRFGIKLLGGDSSRTKGTTTLSICAIGEVATGTASLRRGARAGDLVYVTGTIGDAALGLKVATGELEGLSTEDCRRLIERYRRPIPRLDLGRKLVGLASAAIDISDGLVADLGHVCVVSRVRAVIETARLPFSGAARKAIDRAPALLKAAIIGGDDYEILFTAPASAHTRVKRLAVTEIGRIVAGRGVTVLDPSGRVMTLRRPGFSHF